jgi:hypothetical protein
MDPSVLNNLSRSIRSIDTRRLAGRISLYIRLSAAVEESLRRPDLNGDRVASQLEACCWGLFGDIPLFLDQLTRAREEMVDLHYTGDGAEKRKKPAIEASKEDARQCFDALKRHGMELLAHLTDEIGIVQEILRQGEEVRRIISGHLDPMTRSARLFDILLERFARRPTVAYRVGGATPDVKQLAYAVEGMEGWQSDSASDDRGSAESLRVATLSPYGAVIRSMWEELEQRSRKIADAGAELREGWDLLCRLSARGYSRKIRKQTEALSHKHRARRHAFKTFIRESRAAAPDRRSGEGA